MTTTLNDCFRISKIIDVIPNAGYVEVLRSINNKESITCNNVVSEYNKNYTEFCEKSNKNYKLSILNLEEVYNVCTEKGRLNCCLTKSRESTCNIYWGFGNISNNNIPGPCDDIMTSYCKNTNEIICDCIKPLSKLVGQINASCFVTACKPNIDNKINSYVPSNQRVSLKQCNGILNLNCTILLSFIQLEGTKALIKGAQILNECTMKKENGQLDLGSDEDSIWSLSKPWLPLLIAVIIIILLLIFLLIYFLVIKKKKKKEKK